MSDHPIDRRAALLQIKLRDRIAERCTTASRLSWETIAEQAAADLLGDEWEWRVLTTVGMVTYPEVVITRHLGHQPDEPHPFETDGWSY